MHTKFLINHEFSICNLGSLSCLIPMLGFLLFYLCSFVNCRMWMKIKLDFWLLLLWGRPVPSTGEKSALTVLLAVDVGIPACILCVESLQLCWVTSTVAS